MTNELKQKTQEFLKKNNMTKKAFAAHAKIGIFTVERLLTMENWKPRVETVEKIKNALTEKTETKNNKNHKPEIIIAKVSFMATANVDLQNGNIIKINSIDKLDINEFKILETIKTS
jgi:hypothetical protein